MADTDNVPTAEEILENAERVDRGENIDTPAAKAKPDATEQDTAADEPSGKTKDETPKADAKDEPESKSSKEAKNSADEPKAKEKEKSKWAQNEERKNKTWDQINAEKEAVKAEKEALAKERAEVEKARKSPVADALRDEHGHTAKDYAAVADKYRRDGNAEYAEAAQKLADTMAQKEVQARQQQAQQEFQSSWEKNYDDQCAKIPELKDRESPLYKDVVKVLNDFPLLQRDVKGLNYAIQAAQLQRQAKEFDGTKAELTKLKADHDKLLKKLSIGGGSPTGAPAEDKPFERMSAAEQGRYLERAVANHDRAAGFDD